MTAIPKPVKPKQIAGRGVTRQNKLPPGLVGKPSSKGTDYGVIIKIIWRDRLMNPRIETLKLLKETEWSVDAIDCDGNMHDRLTKTDFIFLGYADEMAIICEPEVEYGVLWRIISKKDLMHGKEEIIRVTDLPDVGQTFTYIDETGKNVRGQWRSDFFFLGIIKDEDAPEPLKLKNLKNRKHNDAEDSEEYDGVKKGHAWSI